MRGSGPRERKLEAALRRRERVPAEKRPEFDARLLASLSRPLAIVYTDTSDFTTRAARDGILHFLMAFNRAFGCLRPVIAGAGGRVVKIEADSLMLAFPDAAAACAAVEGMERTLRQLNGALPQDEQVAFSYGIGFGTLLDLGDDLFGLEVNLASKLGEDLGRRGEVLLTPAAVAALPARLRRRLTRYATVRFSGTPLPVHRLRLSRAGRSRPV